MKFPTGGIQKPFWEPTSASGESREVKQIRFNAGADGYSLDERDTNGFNPLSLIWAQVADRGLGFFCPDSGSNFMLTMNRTSPEPVSGSSLQGNDARIMPS